MDADMHERLSEKTGGKFKLAVLIQRRAAEIVREGVGRAQTGRLIIEKAANEVADGKVKLMTARELLGGPSEAEKNESARKKKKS